MMMFVMIKQKIKTVNDKIAIIQFVIKRTIIMLGIINKDDII